jgi:hypothetical protein
MLSAMAEWLILLLLVPAVVVPAVLLFGFAGCNPIFGLDPTVLAVPPVMESVTGTSISSITVTWTHDHTGDFEIERTRLPDPSKPPPLPGDPEYEPKTFPAPAPPLSYEDSGLVRATVYQYRVRVVYSDGGTGDWSERLTGATQAGFAILDVTQTENFGNVGNATVKCEIVVADLIAPAFVPARMWITLGQLTSAGESVTFSKVFIGHKAAGGDAWDAISLTPVRFGSLDATVVEPGNTIRSDEIPFGWDRTSALVLSMFFAGGPTSDLLYARTMSNSSTHLKNSVDEAATADATAYNSFAGYLSGAVKIEVAD